MAGRHSLVTSNPVHVDLIIIAFLQFQLYLRMTKCQSRSHSEQGARSARSISLFYHKGARLMILLLPQLWRSWHATIHSTAAASRMFTASLSLPSALHVLIPRQHTDHKTVASACLDELWYRNGTYRMHI
jgi:hypothetical protein